MSCPVRKDDDEAQLMASVEYLVNPAAAQAVWIEALGRVGQPAPFDRLEWWSALHELCLPDEQPLFALASEGEARCAARRMRPRCCCVRAQ